MKINIEKYQLESLEFINSLAEKQLNETLVSFRELTNKSYLFIGLVLSIESLAVNKVLSNEDSNVYIFIFIAMIIPALVIFKNLLPTKMSLSGAKPDSLVHQFYEDRKGFQMKYYLKFRLIDINEAISRNGIEINKRSTRLKNSVIYFILVLVAVLVFWFLNA